MSELKILSHLGYHDNIVNLLGACTQGGKDNRKNATSVMLEIPLWVTFPSVRTRFWKYLIFSFYKLYIWSGGPQD